MRCTATLILGAVLAAAVARAEDARSRDDSATVRGLVRNAWYWQARAREDKAEEAWKQVLAVAPDHPDALAALGGFSARAGRADAAREALARMEKVAPGHPDLPVLRREIQLGTRAGPILAAARKLVHEGHVEEGVARYRELFGDAGPPGDLALEYYQTVGGAKDGWEEARDGLRRLARRAPGEVRIRLALAKLLTYRDETRREGIEILSELARDRTVAREATASWRQALLWLSPTPADTALLRSYLRAHPRDAEIAQKLEANRSAGTVQEGYAALERGDLDEAERLFDAAREQPDARRGLGLVAERRALQRRKAGFAALERGDLARAEELFDAAGDDPDSRFGHALVASREAAQAQRGGDLVRARALLERARRLAPAHRELWEAPLRSVAFWQRLQEAQAARAAGRDAEAEATLLDALEGAPDADRWHAQLALGDLYLARGQPARAEARYRDVLSARPDQPDVLRGLASILVAGGRWQDAIAVNDRLLRVAPERALRAGWLRAEERRSRATRAHAARDLAGARAELEAARREDPRNVWVLHDLANVLLEMGATAQARPVVRALLAVAPELPEARVVEARLLASDGDGSRALQILSALPSRLADDPGLATFRRRLEVQVRVPALVAEAQAGRRADAVRELAALERQVDEEPQLAGSVAVAWSRLGDFDRAVSVMRRAIARSPTATRSMRLELASTLLEAGDDAGMSVILAGLERDPSLTPDERRWLADLRVSQAVRAADRARDRGDARAASAALAPVLRDYPQDVRVVGAQGRLLERGDPRRAHEAFLRVLDAAPDDADARRGAVDTALALGDVDEARVLAGEGARRHPEDARMHVLVARSALGRGDDGAAMRAYERAWAIVSAPGVPPGTAASAAPPGRSAAGLTEGAARRAALAPPDPPLRADVEREMDRIRDRHSPGLNGELGARTRTGEEGLGRILELRQEFAADVPVGYRGRATLHAAEVELFAGTIGGASRRFGTGGDVPADSEQQQAMGTELGVRYVDPNVVAEFGRTPLGFPVQALVGALRLQGGIGPLRLAIEGARRGITDSVLSYAGVKDPATGEYWGGVVAQGGRAELALQGDAGRIHGYGGYDQLVGFHVAENRRTTAGGGVEARVGLGAWGAITAGVEAIGFLFDRNLRFFTFGHGGYFSPQRFLRGGVPVGWRRDAGRVRWDLVAAPGYEWFREDGAAAFPVAPSAGEVDLTATYPGQTRTGFTLDARGAVGVAIGGGLDLRLAVGLQQAPEFQELRGAVLLRFGGPGGLGLAGW